MQEHKVQRSSKKAEVHHCKRCMKTFKLQWELNRHIKQCRTASSSHVKTKRGGWYHCDICPDKERSSYLLKSHVFHEHTEAQVQATYNRTMERFLGNSALTKLRKNMLLFL